MEQNIIFLDIDGVVNSTASSIVKIGPTIESPLVRELDLLYGLPYGAMYALSTVDPVCVGLVNLLIKEADAHLVLSSTHRMHFRSSTTPHGSKEHLDILRKYLTAMGFTVPLNFSVTPIMHTARGSEVNAWLEKHTTLSTETPHVILDDSRDFGNTQPLVPVDGAVGFSFTDYNSALAALNISARSAIIY